MYKKIILLSFPVLYILAGCSKKDEVQPEPPQGEEVVVVLNNLSETYSFYFPESSDTLIDVDTTGSAPNDILIDGNYAYIVNSGFGGKPSIMKIDLERDSLVASFTFPDGSNPYGVVKYGDNIYVTCTRSNMLYEFDLYLTPVDSVRVGKSPEWLTAKNGVIYVACTGYDFSSNTFGEGWIAVVTRGPSGLYVKDSLYGGINPQDVDIIGDSLYVLSTGDYGDIKGKIYIYSLKDTVAFKDSINVGNSPGYMYPYNGCLYIVDWAGGFAKVNPRTNEVIWQEVGEGASRVVIDYNNIGFLTRFNATSANYIIIFDPEDLAIRDSVFMGNAKGIQGLALWMRIH